VGGGVAVGAALRGDFAAVDEVAAGELVERVDGGVLERGDRDFTALAAQRLPVGQDLGVDLGGVEMLVDHPEGTEESDALGGLPVANELGCLAEFGETEAVVAVEGGGSQSFGEDAVEAANVHGGDLAVVADLRDLRAGLIGEALQGQAVAGGDHASFVEQHERSGRDCLVAVLNIREKTVEGAGLDACGLAQRRRLGR